MSSFVLPDAINAARLTELLRDAGVLGEGRVRDVAVASSNPTILSRITRLSLDYENVSDAPRSLVLKTGNPDRPAAAWNPGRQEVAFYTKVAAGMSPPLVPRCFDAQWDPATNAWHLLLEDLAATHEVATTWPLPPTMAQCRRIVAARAQFQAAWWDDPRLGVSVGTRYGADALADFLQRCRTQFGQFVERFGDRLPRARRDLIERYLDAAPRLDAQYVTRRDLTIVHGDAHVWNCFLPRDADSTDVRLFDWDSWRIDTASDDLAYMMAIHWYPDLRSERERALLDHFHATLTAHGVTGYDRHALHRDYRLSVLSQMMFPILQCANGIPPVIWWNNLERVLMAVDDLDCAALLA